MTFLRPLQEPTLPRVASDTRPSQIQPRADMRLSRMPPFAARIAANSSPPVSRLPRPLSIWRGSCLSEASIIGSLNSPYGLARRTGQTESGLPSGFEGFCSFMVPHRHMGFLIPLLVPSHCATTGVGPFTPQDRHQLMRVPTPPPGAHPRDNIIAGTAYLREMLDRYGTVPAMLAAYNAGPARYDEHLAAGRSLPAETRAYVALLAPALGSAVPWDGPRTALRQPADWREAPLFVARAGDRQPAAGHPPNGTRPSVPTQTDSAAGLQAAPIFLTRREGEGPQ